MEFWLHKKRHFYLFIFCVELLNLGVISARINKPKLMHALGFTEQTKPRLNSMVSIWIQTTQSLPHLAPLLFQPPWQSFNVRLYFSHTFDTKLLHTIWACSRHSGVRGDSQVDSSKPGSSLICSTQLFAARGFLWGSSLIDSDGKIQVETPKMSQQTLSEGWWTVFFG